MIGPLLLAYAVATAAIGLGMTALIRGWIPGWEAKDVVRDGLGVPIRGWRYALICMLSLAFWPVVLAAGIIMLHADDGEG